MPCLSGRFFFKEIVLAMNLDFLDPICAVSLLPPRKQGLNGSWANYGPSYYITSSYVVCMLQGICMNEN